MQFVLSLVVLTASVCCVVGGDDVACLTVKTFSSAGCSGDPAEDQSAAMPTEPTDTCLPFDNPTFGKCSLNHEYCDLLKGQFKETIYIASGTCDKKEALYVQDQVLDNDKCYNAQGTSVMVSCAAGSCPSTTASAKESVQALLDIITTLDPLESVI